MSFVFRIIAGIISQCKHSFSFPYFVEKVKQIISCESWLSHVSLFLKRESVWEEERSGGKRGVVEKKRGGAPKWGEVIEVEEPWVALYFWPVLFDFHSPLFVGIDDMMVVTSVWLSHQAIDVFKSVFVRSFIFYELFTYNCIHW